MTDSLSDILSGFEDAMVATLVAGEHKNAHGVLRALEDSLDATREAQRAVRLTLGGDGRPPFDEHFMGYAKQAATRGECRRSQVGCVYVLDRHIVATGYNGAKAGEPSCLTGACPRGLLSYEEVSALSSYSSGRGLCIGTHAEDNGIRDARARGIDLTGTAAYVTREPCAWCWWKMAGEGVASVMYPGQKVNAPARAVAVLPAKVQGDDEHLAFLFASAVGVPQASTLGICSISEWESGRDEIIVEGTVGTLQ